MRILITFLLICLQAAVLFPAQIIKNFSPASYGYHRQNWSIIQDDRGILYYANSDGVLEFDSVTWRLIPLADGRSAYSLAKDPQGRIYVGGEREIGYLVPDEIGVLRYRSLLEKIPPSYRDFKDRVSQIEVTPKGAVFLSDRHLFIAAAEDKGIDVFTTKDHFFSFLSVQSTGELYAIDGIRGLLRLEKGRLKEVPGGRLLRAHVMLPLKNGKILIVTTQRGPIIFDPTAGAAPLYPLTQQDQDFFSNNLITCGVLLADDFIALGSEKKGMMIMAPDGSKIFHAHEAVGLQDNHVYGIHADSRGNIWLGLDRGISMIRRDAPTKDIPFSGLIRATRKFSDDTMLFGGAFFSLETVNVLRDQPEHLILEFPHDANAFRFIFASNNYEEIEKTEYQCIMDGLDRDWSSWMKRTSREYTNLEWGTYTFRVRARNFSGEISEEGTYSLLVHPAWHETWWFLTAQILFILSLLLASRLTSESERTQKVSEYFVIFAVIIILKYMTSFMGPVIGRYSYGIGFFKIFMSALLAFMLMPVKKLIQRTLKKTTRKKSTKEKQAGTQ
ncbi:MAG: hypothetical protein GY950_25295 [bacterium]|nr:hypothetical protein [bacterium]